MKYKSRAIGFLWCVLMTLAVPPDQAQAGNAKEGKEDYDSITSGVSVAYPAAGAMFAVVGEFLDLTGYFGNAESGATDPIAAAITVINQRLAELERRMQNLEDKVQALKNDVRSDENLARVRLLRVHKNQLQKILTALARKPTDAGVKQDLVVEAQQVAADIRSDSDLWLWSDLVVKDVVWDGKAVKVGDYLNPDFKPWPVMEVYTLSLITWMAAIEYAADGNRQAVMQAYGPELQLHIDFLSVRSGWNEGRDEARTLPENIKKRINGSLEADKYPEDGICYWHEYVEDTMAREVRVVQTSSYPAHDNNVLCNVPQPQTPAKDIRPKDERDKNPFPILPPTDGEENLERKYGIPLMTSLAGQLTRLKNYGTFHDQLIGTFEKTPPNSQALWIYAIGSNGDLIWYRKDSTGGAWQGPKKVGTGWNSFKEVIPAGGNSLYALTNDGKLMWYRHDGFMDGSDAWRPAVEVGSGWTFSRIFSGGQGIVYAITDDGRLVWYRNNGADYGLRSWQPEKVIGSGWNDFKTVFSTGLGAIYAVRNDGRMSLYRHDGYDTGAATWQPERIVGAGWNSFQQIIPGSDGVILAILPSGKLLWYRDLGKATVKTLGRVKLAGPQPPPDPSRAMQSICDVAREARARGNAAAPGLEGQCRAFQASFVAVDAQTLATLQAKGPAIANTDPLFTELRNREPEGPARRGFDIGMAAAEGNTLAGPGKQRIRDSLAPEEQPGFEIAVAFSLERNRNADLAARGAAVAKVDTRVAVARTNDPDVFYWLGLDIATGLFGDSKLGGVGNTAIGPGALKIRDSLSAAGQRGFTAGVDLQLGANSNATPTGNPNSAFTMAGKNPDRAASTLLAQLALPTLETGDGPVELGSGWQSFGKVIALIPDPPPAIR